MTTQQPTPPPRARHQRVEPLRGRDRILQWSGWDRRPPAVGIRFDGLQVHLVAVRPAPLRVTAAGWASVPFGSIRGGEVRQPEHVGEAVGRLRRHLHLPEGAPATIIHDRAIVDTTDGITGITLAGRQVEAMTTISRVAGLRTDDLRLDAPLTASDRIRRAQQRGQEPLAVASPVELPAEWLVLVGAALTHLGHPPDVDVRPASTDRSHAWAVEQIRGVA